MATTLDALVSHCDGLLDASRFRDYCPNGLQVQGRSEVRRIACAVTANQSVLDAAVQWGADALLVHHGYFWRGESEPIVGMKRRRLGTLLAADLSLLAYHLPLDAHPELGNNAQLGQRLGVMESATLFDTVDDGVGNVGCLPEAQPLVTLVESLATLTGRAPLLVGDGQRSVCRVAWCTGAAQDYIERAAQVGAEVYISGEISEQTVHAARELGVAYIAAGHHATERYGVQALAASVASSFDMDWCFLDCDNPV